ncbi:MAG: UDP-N-acetylmuramoyl-L-alanine--D-glutamate ligase [Phycisphaeraceae bacterium]|nr:UDP-N-acetylmuramoyl-L-alanine--D-glutamate ligase [Phycisphaeraceae bacterium]
MEFAGQRITVMGLGRFGGGVGVTRFLAERGADVLVTDLDPEDKLAESLGAIRDLVDSGRVRLRLGGHNVSDFTTCDLVVANPAVPRPWENRFLRAAGAAGIPVTTEIRLLVDCLPTRDRVVGITGSAGKSTTSAMIAHALGRLGERVHLGGNIGGSLLGRAIGPHDWVVLELSSFQLHWLGQGPAWSPRVAVITNITPNHLDWHGDMEHYRACKVSMARRDGPRDVAVLGEGVVYADGRRVVRVHAADQRGRLSVPGEHNRANARAAVLAVLAALEKEHDSDFARRVEESLADFAGLPHRLCLIGERDGVRYFDDSKSTTPESTLLALGAFGAEVARVHLIAGGYDKGMDLTPIAQRAGSLAGLYCIGTTGPGLASLAAGAEAVFACGTLEEAVEHARRRAKPGDVVLLSPACASWDQFVNYEARGKAFAALVRGARATAGGTQ